MLGAVTVLGDFWTLGILRSAVFGERRYGGFQRELGLATNVLAERLARLVDVGVLARVPYQERPVRHEYVLTEMGAELVPLVLALKAWGDRYLQPDGPYTEVRHAGCGGRVEVVARCAECGGRVAAAETETVSLRQP